MFLSILCLLKNATWTKVEFGKFFPKKRFSKNILLKMGLKNWFFKTGSRQKLKSLTIMSPEPKWIYARYCKEAQFFIRPGMCTRFWFGVTNAPERNTSFYILLIEDSPIHNAKFIWPNSPVEELTLVAINLQQKR